jgi:hypothetical protein
LVVIDGDTLMLLPVWPLDQETTAGAKQPLAVNVVLCPEHKEAVEGETVGVKGKAFTVTARVEPAPEEQDIAPVLPHDAV